MNIKEIKGLMKMLVETDITELNLESDGTKIVIKKGIPGTVQPVVKVTPTPAPVACPEGNVVQPEATVITSALEEKEKPLALNQEYICAEIVGTFYKASSPGEEPFVDLGQTVEPGQTLCIIEAMKVMNEIESPARAKVIEVLVEDAQPVEYGQPLFLIERI